MLRTATPVVFGNEVEEPAILKLQVVDPFDVAHLHRVLQGHGVELDELAPTEPGWMRQHLSRKLRRDDGDAAGKRHQAGGGAPRPGRSRRAAP